jgi:hypothetical protein
VTFDPTTEVIEYDVQQQTSRHSRPTSAGSTRAVDTSEHGHPPPPLEPPADHFGIELDKCGSMGPNDCHYSYLVLSLIVILFLFFYCNKCDHYYIVINMITMMMMVMMMMMMIVIINEK